MPNIGYSVDTVAFLQDTVNTPAGANLNVDQSLLVGSDFNVDSGKFFVDQSTGNIGIGTTTPSTLLDIYGDGSNTTQISLRQWNTGNDGPDIRFFCSGGTIASPVEPNTGDILGKVNAFVNTGSSYDQFGGFGWTYRHGVSSNRGSSFAIETKSTNESINSAKIYISEEGAVGIGTASPISVNLQVNGFYNSGTSEYGAPTQYFLTTLSSPSAGDNIGRIIFARNGDSATIAAKSTGTADETDLYFYNRTSGGADNVNNVQNTTPTLKLYHDKTAEFAGNVTVNGSVTQQSSAAVQPLINSTGAQSDLFFRCANNSFSTIVFGDQTNTLRRGIRYDSATDQLEFKGANMSSTHLSVDSSGNLTLSAELRGPASFVIDPAAVGDNTGTVIIKGDLQVDGTTTTINSTTLTVDDKNIVLASGAANAAAADGAGITIDGANQTFIYESSNDSFKTSTRLGIRATPNITSNLRIGGNAGGEGNGTTYYALLNNPVFQSDVTTVGYYNFVQVKTGGNSGTAYTLSNIEGYAATVGSGTIHADSTITNLVGFNVKGSWTAGTNNYGFKGNIDEAANTNRWNVYMDGSAPNYFAGNVGIGTSSPGSKLELGTSTDYLNAQGIAVLKPHSLGLQNANYAYTDAGYNGTASYLTAGFKSNAPDEKTGAFIASTGAGVDGLGGTVNAAIYHDGQGYFAGSVGIGTDNPQSALEVVAPDSAGLTEVLRVKKSNAGDACVFRIDLDPDSNIVKYAATGSQGGAHVFGQGGAGEYMRIDSNGNVGIGTISPGEALEVVAAGPTIKSRATGNDAAKLAMDSDRAAGVIGAQILSQWNGNTVSRIDFLNGADGTNKDDGEIRFLTSTSASNPQPRMSIDSTGNVGIGTTTPSTKLDVSGAVNIIGSQNDPVLNISSNANYIRDVSDGTNDGGHGIVQIGGPDGSYVISTQDGTGRIQHRWNSSTGSSPTFLVGSENAAFWEMNAATPGEELFAIYYDNGGTASAGDAINLNTIFTLGINEITWRGNPDTTTTTAFKRWEVTNDQDTSTSSGATYMQLKGNDSNRSGWRLVAGDDATAGYFKIQDFSGGSWTTNLYISETGQIGIGTESPDNLLEISEPSGSTTPAKMKIVNEGDRGVTIGFLDHNASPDFAISNGDQTNHFLTIAGGGDVGINTTDPVEQLHIDSGNVIIGQTSGATTNIRNYVKFGRTTGPKAAIGFINNDSNARGDLLFMNSAVSDANEFTDTEEVMRITKDGYVGIGATAPTSRLQIGEPTTANADNYILFGRRGSSQTETNTPFIGQSGGTYTTADLGLGARSTSGRIRFYTGNTTVFDPNNERMIIDASGNVGIGTSSPGALLEIAGTATPAIRLKDLDGTNQFGQILANNGLLLLESRNDTSDGQIVFRGRDNVGTNEYGRFDENGNFGIGETNPTEKLHVVGGNILVEHNAPFIKFAETGLTGSPVFWAGMDGGAWTVRLNNSAPYPLRIPTKGANNDSIDFIGFGGDTLTDALKLTAHGTNPTYLDLKGNNANARMRYYQGTTERWNIGYDTSISAFTFYDAQSSVTRMFMYDDPNNGIVIGTNDNGGFTWPSTDGGGATAQQAALRVDGKGQVALFCYNNEQSGDPVAIFAKGNEADDNQVVIIAGDGDGSEELLDIRSNPDPVSTSDLLSFARDNANSVFRVYGDGEVYVKGNIASAPVFITTYGAGNLDITTEQTVVLDSTLATSGTSDFTVSAGGVITVLKTGTYQISYSITTDVTSGTGRSTSYAYLRINGVGEQTASRTYMYNREANNGENTSSKTMMFALTANDTIELRAARNSGTDTVVVLENYTTLALHRLT